MIKRYFQYRRELKEKHGVPWNKQEDHYANCFGLEKMRKLLAKADAYNEITILNFLLWAYECTIQGHCRLSIQMTVYY